MDCLILKILNDATNEIERERRIKTRVLIVLNTESTSNLFKTEQTTTSIQTSRNETLGGTIGILIFQETTSKWSASLKKPTQNCLQRWNLEKVSLCNGVWGGEKWVVLICCHNGTLFLMIRSTDGSVKESKHECVPSCENAFSPHDSSCECNFPQESLRGGQGFVLYFVCCPSKICGIPYLCFFQEESHCISEKSEESSDDTN